MPRSQRPNVADLLELKGRRQFTMLRVTTLAEAEAAQRAGIEMLSVTLPAGLEDRAIKLRSRYQIRREALLTF